MPRRNATSGEKYRYGYQGQFAEEDEEAGWVSFELRNYDARIARWTSIDPAEQFYSPYVSMGNDPVNMIDRDGAFSSSPGMGIDESISGGIGEYLGSTPIGFEIGIIAELYEGTIDEVISYGTSARPSMKVHYINELIDSKDITLRVNFYPNEGVVGEWRIDPTSFNAGEVWAVPDKGISWYVGGFNSTFVTTPENARIGNHLATSVLTIGAYMGMNDMTVSPSISVGGEYGGGTVEASMTINGARARLINTYKMTSLGGMLNIQAMDGNKNVTEMNTSIWFGVPQYKYEIQLIDDNLRRVNLSTE